MKKILLLLVCTIGIASMVNAQGNRRSTFRVDAPASIAGEKIFDEGDTTSPALPALPWGRGVDSAWENMDVKYDPTNLEGCTPFAANFFTGKFALIHRGNCEFGAKVKAAQDAGARGVIIVNRLEGVLRLGAGDSGYVCNIPVIMVPRSVGDAMTASIANSVPVSISLTGWRFNAVTNPLDVSIKNNSVIFPQGRSIPANQLSTATNLDDNFRLFTGGRFYNHSLAQVDTVNLKGVFTTPTSTDSNTVNLVGSVANPFPDSIFLFMLDSAGSALAGFDLNDLTNGQYKMKNVLAPHPNSYMETGLNALNNTYEYTFNVTDSIYTKGEYNLSAGKPVVNDYFTLTAAANVTLTNEWGPVFYFRNDGHAARNMQCVIMRGSQSDSTYAGQIVEMKIYEWNDIDANGGMDDTELTQVGEAVQSLTASDIVPIGGLTITAPVTNTLVPNEPVRFRANTTYWCPILIDGNVASSYGIGMDYYSDYRGTLSFAGLNNRSAYGNTLRTEASTASPNVAFFGGGYSAAGSPAIALHISKNRDVTSVSKIEGTNGIVKLYPNPTTDILNVDITLEELSKNVQYEILDMSGRTISIANRTNITNEVFSVNTSNLTSGSYFLKVTTDNATQSLVFSVAK